MQSPDKPPAENGSLLKLDEAQLLRTLLDLLPDGILVKGLDRKYIWGNRAKLRELGVSGLKDVVGKTAFDFFKREEAESFKRDDDRVLEGGLEIVNYREKVIEPDGSVHWHLTSKLPWRDDNGKIIGLIAISRDITEQANAEMRLQEERNLLRTLIDHLPDAIFAKDAQARKLMANAADLKNMGCQTEAEAIGKSDFDLFPKEIAAAFFADDQSVLDGRPVINREEKFLKNNETRWLLTSKIPWHDANGKIIGLIGIGRDITEKKNLEEQIVQAQRMESIGRLATGIAHDLNNILAPILMSIEMLREKLQDKEYLEMLAKAEANAHRGADIVKQMLWFSRGLTGKRGPVNLHQLLGDIAQFASETYGRDIRVEKQIPNDLWTVNGDLTQLHQALMNLCANAREAMPGGGTLTIGARNAGVDGNRFVILEIIDTGVGFVPELADKIFEPFFTTKAVGHGLGLSTAHSIIKSHGGFIKTESQPGKGAAFRIHLPAAQM